MRSYTTGYDNTLEHHVVKQEDFIQLKTSVEELSREMALLKEKFRTVLTLVDETGMVPSGRYSKWRFVPALPYTEENLYPVETNGTQDWRWVGPQPQVGFTLNLARLQRLSVRVRVGDFISPEVQDSFRILVDGVELPWISTSENLFESILDIDPAAHARGTTELVLRSILATRPEDEESIDKRVLSFALTSIEVDPL